MRILKNKTFSWVLYDWANSAFALIIITAIYPQIFAQHWAQGMSKPESTYWLGIGASAASLLVAIAAPLLGIIADHGKSKQRFLRLFALIGIITTALLFWVGDGSWQIALMIYMLAMIGFSCANIFYDALLPDVSAPQNQHKVSAWGFSFGYAGSTLLLLICLYLIKSPHSFGISSSLHASKLSFLMVSGWWLLFSFPIFFLQQKSEEKSHSLEIKNTLRELLYTFKEILKNKVIAIFFISYWFYIDGVNTIIKMASKLGSDLGIGMDTLMGAIILVQLIGIPCALLFGFLGQKYGPKTLIIFGMLIYLAVVLYASAMDATPITWGKHQIHPIYLLAAGIGLAQGGIQALSRSYFSSLIPLGKESAYFGIYNIIGKSASILGPLLVGQTALITGSTQSGIKILSVFFIIGIVGLVYLKWLDKKIA